MLNKSKSQYIFPNENVEHDELVGERLFSDTGLDISSWRNHKDGFNAIILSDRGNNKDSINRARTVHFKKSSASRQ